MDLASYLRFAAALVLVLGLIGVAAWAARRFGFVKGLPMAGGRGRRLDVVEVGAIDTKRRLVLVRRDGVEHLLLLGPAGDTVVESGIAAPPKAPEAARRPGTAKAAEAAR